MFADLVSQKVEIEEGSEIVGFAVCWDENKVPCWIDFVVAQGGKWQYKYGSTCMKYHPLHYRTTPKVPNSLQESDEHYVPCSLCVKEIDNSDDESYVQIKATEIYLSDGYFTCQDDCSFVCCRHCFNY